MRYNKLRRADSNELHSADPSKTTVKRQIDGFLLTRRRAIFICASSAASLASKR